MPFENAPFPLLLFFKYFFAHQIAIWSVLSVPGDWNDTGDSWDRPSFGDSVHLLIRHGSCRQNWVSKTAKSRVRGWNRNLSRSSRPEGSTGQRKRGHLRSKGAGWRKVLAVQVERDCGLCLTFSLHLCITKPHEKMMSGIGVGVCS